MQLTLIIIATTKMYRFDLAMRRCEIESTLVGERRSIKPLSVLKSLRH